MSFFLCPKIHFVQLMLAVRGEKTLYCEISQYSVLQVHVHFTAMLPGSSGRPFHNANCCIPVISLVTTPDYRPTYDI